MIRLLTLLLLAGTPLAASPDEPPSVSAQRTQGSIVVDGALDEETWQLAAIASQFRQFDPVEGAAGSQRTEVRIAYSTTSLYIGARLFDDTPDAIRTILGRRDDADGDAFSVSIDGFADGRTAYRFAVNAAGVQEDGIQNGNNYDGSWDAIWTSAVRRDSEGWTVEMRIPYSMLRFSERDMQTWGINFVRVIPRTSEQLEWSLVTRDVRSRGVVQGFGRLTGIQGVKPRRAIQITPYVLSGGRAEPGIGRVETGGQFDAGANAKIGLSSNATLDLAFNPDFGQVESDPAELNLSAFETFFSERRPFFVEGLDLFQTNGDAGQALYTRRIGQNAPIIGAAKLFGQREGGLSYGALAATTGDDFSPNRSFAAFRLLQRRGTSEYGALVTAFDDKLTGGNRRAFAGVADWNLQLFDDTYRVSGNLSASHRTTADLDGEMGFAGSIEGERLTGDWRYSAGINLTDDQFSLNEIGRLRRNNTIGLSGRVSHELNGGQPIGGFRRVSFRMFSGNSFTYDKRLSQGFGVFAFSNFELNSFHSFEVKVTTDYLFGGYDQFETRGLGANARPRQLSVGIDYDTDSRKLWRVSPEAEVSIDGDGRFGVSGELGASWRVSDRFDVRGDVSYDRDRGSRSWIANEAFRQDSDGWRIGNDRNDPGADDADFPRLGPSPILDDAVRLRTPLADGTLYVPLFGLRDSEQMEVQLRATTTFTPTISLQLFSQLFATRGTHRNFDLLATADERLPFDAYPKRAEFSFASFQLNTVFRWEYQPGSTLFLVWTQSRNISDDLRGFESANENLFDQSARDQFGDVFGRYPTNVLLLKLSYLILR